MPVYADGRHQENYPRYQAYLLRLWQEHPGAQWRVMLRDVAGEEQWGFSDAGQCFEFIRQQLQKECREEH